MFRRRISSVLLLVIATSVLLGCRKQNTAENGQGSSSRPQVFVTNYPLKYFAQRIAGSATDIQFPMEPHGDPAFWQPNADTIARYQAADVILINGATYEKWIATATLPETKIVDTSTAFRDKFIQIADAITHSHGPGGEHSHAGTAFTTWLDFDQAIQQATAIRDSLLKVLPDHASEINGNYDALVTDLRQLDRTMNETAHKIGDRPLVASHPVYDYWARRYSLRLVSVHWEPDIVPSDEAIQDLKEKLESHPAQVMIWEGKPEEESIDKLKAMGLASVVFDPCGNISENGDWLTVMRANLNSLSKWAEGIQ